MGKSDDDGCGGEGMKNTWGRVMTMDVRRRDEEYMGKSDDDGCGGEGMKNTWGRVMTMDVEEKG